MKTELMAGELDCNGKIATEPELSKRYNVSIGTIRKVVGSLEKEKILERHQGRGTFLVDKGIHSHNKMNNSRLTAGYSLNFFSQEEIDAVLFGKERDIKLERKRLSEIKASGNELPEDWKDCDIVQISHLVLHLPGVEEYFAPAPESLVKQFSEDVSDSVIDECSSLGGKLLLVPYVSNPGIMYAHIPSFEKSGIDLPASSWTWDDFLEICRKLKKDDKMPFGYFPAAGCFFDHLLFQAGGEYFNNLGEFAIKEKPFKEMVNFLRTMHKEHLFINLYNLSSNYPKFIKEAGVCMSSLGPLLGHLLQERSNEWTFLPLPGNSNSQGSMITMGWGVNKNSAKTEEAWAFLAETFSKKGKLASASLSMVFPVWKNLQKTWKCGDIKNPGAVREIAENSRLLPGRKAYKLWWQEYFDLLEEAMRGAISLEVAYEKAANIIQKKQPKNSQFELL
jgi:ABC-type glycerol-3-phosphate transport system substrate-binding protein